MTDIQYILVIRFSAMGDVALTTPVLRSVDKGNDKMLVLTRPSYADFFCNFEGLEVFQADLKGRHKGFAGIIRLVRDINRDFKIKQVVDLHSVLRTWLIDILYHLKGIKVYRINKGRREKKKFIRYKDEANLPHTTERFSDVFRRAGLETGAPMIPSFRLADDADRKAIEIIRHNVPAGYVKIGISPFAKHRTKSWGIDNIRRLMEMIRTEHDAYFFLFGGSEEVTGLESLASSFGNCYIIAGKHSPGTELAIISRLSFMISMDSANMHLAALSGTPTVSIWGGTHPLTGWAPSGNQQHIVIGISMNDLECRPCTVYGKGKCMRKDIKYKCLKDIEPETVYSRLEQSGICC